MVSIDKIDQTLEQLGQQLSWAKLQLDTLKVSFYRWLVFKTDQTLEGRWTKLLLDTLKVSFYRWLVGGGEDACW